LLCPLDLCGFCGGLLRERLAYVTNSYFFMNMSHETHEIHERGTNDTNNGVLAADERRFSQIKNKTAFVCLYLRVSAFICGWVLLL